MDAQKNDVEQAEKIFLVIIEEPGAARKSKEPSSVPKGMNFVRHEQDEMKSHKIFPWTPDEIQKEMQELVVACNGEVVDTMVCRVPDPTASYYLSEGRVKELTEVCSANAFDTIVFSQDLKGSQQRNLEDKLKVKVIDRTQLILDIFAQRATSREGKIQVELAQLEYLLPRLKGKGLEMSRQGGGIGTMGPGETKLESDKQRISQKISALKKQLHHVVDNRQVTRKKRKERCMPVVSLVGYTNAGKSTLLNQLTAAEQVTKNGLFTTLDSLSRQLVLPNHQHIILSDTVGFMRHLPHHLIESFKATLEEVKEADLLLHVVDVSNLNFQHLYESVNEVLNDLEVMDKPVLMVLNKIDQIDDKEAVYDLEDNFDHAITISALEGNNVEHLLSKIEEMLSELYVQIDTEIPIDRMDLVSLAHEYGEVSAIKYYNDHIHIRASLPANLSGKFRIENH